MTIKELNKYLIALSDTVNKGSEQSRNNIFEFSFGLLEWMGILPNTANKPQLLNPKTQKLRDCLFNAPRTVQPQLYRLSANNQNVRVRLAVLKKIKREYISQLVDNDPGLGSYQAMAKGLARHRSADSAPTATTYIPSQPYFIHFITTPEYDKLTIILTQGDQKRILNFGQRLSHTQSSKILPLWQGIGEKPKLEIADLIWKSTDIKEVNTDFYKKIKERFDTLVGISKNQVPHTMEADLRQFAVRLIGRYVFCWFLKEKGVIEPELLSSKTIADNEENYFQKYLYQLFFNTLNEEVQTRTTFKTNSGLDKLYDKIPYLNGGLFDKHPEDFLFGKLDINSWLIIFVEILEDFDFTVDESNSQFQQVAIDPEMLGRIFENLLASQNEQTTKLANNERKTFGAFYTPREIVDYMVDESLKAYLETRMLVSENETGKTFSETVVSDKGLLFPNIPQQTKTILNSENERKNQKIIDKIELFFKPECTINPFDKNETQRVREALRDLKILDPACGSGAFPMGALLRLTELHHIVGHQHKNNYELKQEILSRNIYGIDIMPMAVEIARLRAWLSLVLEAEYKPNDRKNNFGISALPNLDFKFVCANSLIDVPKNNIIELLAFNELTNFEDLTRKYFNASSGDKVILNKSIENCIGSITNFHDNYITSLQKQIIKETNSSSKGKLNTMKKSKEDFEKQHQQWRSYKNLFNNKKVDFFNIKYFFPLAKDGFHIVIGNPPYVQMQKDKGKLADELKDEGYVTFKRTGDVYAIFYELGFKVLSPSGIHCFISSSQWLKTNYGRSLRRLLLTKNPLKLISLGPGIFECAVVDTNILLAKNEQNKSQLHGAIIDKAEQLQSLASLPLQSMPYVSVEEWAIMGDGKQSINEKLIKNGKPLKKWDVKINFGIKTGYNEAFIIGGEKRNALLKADSKSAEIINPILRGKELKKYFTEWDGGYIISTFPALHVNIEEYQAVKNHLEGYMPKIDQIGKTFINQHGNIDKTRKKTGNKWFETQDQIGYYKELSKEKIICKRIGSQLKFSYFNTEIYSLDSTCILTGEKIKYLCALLNSRLCCYKLFESAPRTGMGDLLISVQALNPLLVYYPNESEQYKVEKLIDEILIRKKSKMSTIVLENEIDILVYKFYELTFDEVKIIDKDFWLSETEYNNTGIDS